MIEDYYNYVSAGNCLEYYMTVNNANIGRVGYSSSSISAYKLLGVKMLRGEKDRLLWNDRGCWHKTCPPRTFPSEDQPFCTKKYQPPLDLALYLGSDSVTVGLTSREWNSNYIIDPPQCTDGIISEMLKSNVGRALMTLSFKEVKCYRPPH